MHTSRRLADLLAIYRAGCNFSGISGTDANALKWDRLGYAHLIKLASEHGDEAYIRRTDSIEYWDEHVPHDKIKAISEYLEDVSLFFFISICLNDVAHLAAV